MGSGVGPAKKVAEQEAAAAAYRALAGSDDRSGLGSPAEV